MIVIVIGIIVGRAREKLNLRACTRVWALMMCVICDESHEEFFFFNLGSCQKGMSVRYVCDLYLRLQKWLIFKYLIQSRIECDVQRTAYTTSTTTTYHEGSRMMNRSWKLNNKQANPTMHKSFMIIIMVIMIIVWHFTFWRLPPKRTSYVVQRKIRRRTGRNSKNIAINDHQHWYVVLCGFTISIRILLLLLALNQNNNNVCVYSCLLCVLWFFFFSCWSSWSASDYQLRLIWFFDVNNYVTVDVVIT